MRPDGEIEMVLHQFETVTALPDGGYTATLRPAAAARLAQQPRPPDTPFPAPGENAHGTMKFWARDGHLSRYELSVDANLIVPGRAAPPVRLRIARELYGFGKTKIVLPPEVRRKLNTR